MSDSCFEQDSSPPPTPKRQCSRAVSPRFTSSSSDGAYFPSDQSIVANQGRVTDKDDAADDLSSTTSSSESVSRVASHNSCTEREPVGSLLVSKCCGREFLLHLTALDVLTTRKRFNLLGKNQQRQWLMDKIHESSHELGQGKRQIKFTLSGREICQMSWC